MDGVLNGRPPPVRAASQVNVSYYEGFKVVTDPRTGRSRNVSLVRPEGTAIDAITGFSSNPKLGSQRLRNLHARRRLRGSHTSPAARPVRTGDPVA